MAHRMVLFMRWAGLADAGTGVEVVGGHRMCRQVLAEAGGDEDPVWPKG